MLEPEVIELAKKVHEFYEPALKTASVAEIESGAKGATNKSKYIYILLGEDDFVFYVGETGTNGGIKSRFMTHTPNHKQKEFYHEITEVQFLEGNFTKAERLFIEGAFTIALNPSHMKNRS